MRFIVIGITDHPQPLFSTEVLQVIRNGRVFSGGKRHHAIVEPLLPENATWVDITVPLDDVFEQYLTLRDASQVIVFASGDPLFYGFANTIRRKMPQAHIAVYPAFNALQMLAHRLVMPYHDMRCVSLTGRPWQAFDRALIERSPLIGVLTDGVRSIPAIAQRMLDYGYTNYNMFVGEHLGNPEEECVCSLTLEEAARRCFRQPNCAILNSNPSFGGVSTTPSSFGIPDNQFALLNGREKMITKMPVRLLTLQALDLPRRHVLWDIGACTGSVSIEARLLFPHLQIEAFEIRPECEDIIRENMRRHSAPGIGVHIGDFTLRPSHSDPRPDAVFIGGHGGRLKEIMAQVVEHLQPGGVIVMNSVSSPVVDRITARPSSHQLFEEACQSLRLKTHPALHLTLNGFNPIDILKCELPS